MKNQPVKFAALEMLPNNRVATLPRCYLVISPPTTTPSAAELPDPWSGFLAL